MRAAVLIVALLLTAPAAVRARCAGDCNRDANVTIDELTLAVRGALGDIDVAAACRRMLDADDSGAIGVNDVVAGVGNALGGCAACPRWDTAYAGPCDRITHSAARCLDGGILPLNGGWSIDSDGRLVELTLLSVDPPLSYLATVISENQARITGVRNDRFGVIEPASGSARLFDGIAIIIPPPIDPPVTIDDCRVRSLE